MFFKPFKAGSNCVTKGRILLCAFSISKYRSVYRRAKTVFHCNKYFDAEKDGGSKYVPSSNWF